MFRHYADIIEFDDYKFINDSTINLDNTIVFSASGFKITIVIENQELLLSLQCLCESVKKYIYAMQDELVFSEPEVLYLPGTGTISIQLHTIDKEKYETIMKAREEEEDENKN